MGYINGNKVFAVIKTPNLTGSLYKHSVKMQGTYNNMSITIYADLYTTLNANYATEGFSWDDCMDEWQGVIAGDLDNQRTLQYCECLGSGSVSRYQTQLYENMSDVGTSTFITIDMSVMSFISDTVTPVLL